MGKKPLILNLPWIIKEWMYMELSFIAPFLIFCGSMYFLITQERYGPTTFFISLAVAVLATAYMLIFLVKRMHFKFREGQIVKNQKEIVSAQSTKQLGIGFLIFLLILVLLFGTAIFYGTDKGPFRWVLGAIDVSIGLAVMYSIATKNNSGLKDKSQKAGPRTIPLQRHIKQKHLLRRNPKGQTRTRRRSP